MRAGYGNNNDNDGKSHDEDGYKALASQRVDNDFIPFYFFKVGPKAEDEFHYNCHRIIPEIA